MGVITNYMEIVTSIPPAKLFKALVLNGDTLIPKAMPQAIESIQIVEGDGGVGTIRLTTFGEASQIKSVKQRFDAIDKENFTYSYSILEGGPLTTAGVISVSAEVKFVASPDGGSICKNISKYVVKDDSDVTEEKIKAGKERASGIFKALEAYLLANPDAC